MLTIMKNDWERMKELKVSLIVTLGITLLSMVLAILFHGQMESSINLAVIGNETTIKQMPGLHMVYLEEEPPMSQLVQNCYNAIVTVNKDGTYHITTIHSDLEKQRINNLLSGETNNELENKREIGTSILGFMMMFLLMQGILHMRLFSQDKEKHQIERIFCSPIPFWKYMMGHVLYSYILIFIPCFLLLAVAKLIGVDIGFYLWQYAILLTIVDFFAISLAVCINSFCKTADGGNMTGNSIIILTSILGGTFFELQNQNGIFQIVLKLLPQKGILDFAKGWEVSSICKSDAKALIYAIMIIVGLFLIGVIKTRRDYTYHRS